MDVAKDLRTHLASLRGAPPERFLQVGQPLSPRYELSAVLVHLERRKLFPTVLFHDVENLLGEPGNRVVMNLTALRENLAVAAGLSSEQHRMELTRELVRRYGRPVGPVVIPRSEAPVKARVMVDDADLRRLPVVTTHADDGGPYITMISSTRHPQWDPVAPGVYNLAFNRIQVRGPKEAGILIGAMHNRAVFEMYEREGRPCPIAVVLGHHPMFLLGACTRPPIDVSEYDVIGGFLEQPVRLVASETWGDDFLVPADAEIVVEAEIMPGKREPEGPFGEWTGYTSGVAMSPVLQVRAITMRDEPMLVSNFIGHRDHDGLFGTALEISMFSRVKEVVAGARGVHLPPSGRSGFHAYVQVEKFAEGDQIVAALAAATIGHPKLVVVVDADVDIYDEEQVLMAVACRVRPDADVQVIRNVRGSLLDPSNVGRSSHATLIIDATRPEGKPFPTAVRVPDEVLERVTLDAIWPGVPRDPGTGGVCGCLGSQGGMP